MVWFMYLLRASARLLVFRKGIRRMRKRDKADEKKG